jgi:hypothetical protein
MDESEGINYSLLADTSDQMREVCRAMVAGLIADGFLEVEARCIVAGMWASNIPKQPEEG